MLIIAALLQQSPAAQRPPIASQAPEVRLCRPGSSLRFGMVREFPFVRARIGGVAGRLMLDSGSGAALTLNDRRLALASGLPVGTGFFGSGQRFEVTLRRSVDDVEIDGGRFGNVTTVTSQDATQLEGITPDFLGWIGYQAWAGCAMKLDYRRGVATFYPAGADFLRGERIMASLPFEQRRLPNHPITRASIGGVAFEVAFDTGQNGGIYSSRQTLKALTAGGSLVRGRRRVSHVDVPRIRFEAGPTLAARDLETSETPFPAAKPLGLVSPDVLSLGYSLLRQYKTVWDFGGRRLYLLRR